MARPEDLVCEAGGAGDEEARREERVIEYGSREAIMKSRVLLAAALAVPLGLLAMPPPGRLPSKIALPQAVRLGDGSVLPAGKYDVQIEYRGYGNAAEFHFFLGGIFKGKAPAEARGFPAVAPAGAAGASSVKLEKADTGDIEKVSPELKQKKMISSADDAAAKNFWKLSPAGVPLEFSWQKAGFRAGRGGRRDPWPARDDQALF